MPNPEIIIDVDIISPRGNTWVSSDRRLTVNIAASGSIPQHPLPPGGGGGGRPPGGGGGGGDRPPVQPLSGTLRNTQRVVATRDHRDVAVRDHREVATRDHRGVTLSNTTRNPDLVGEVWVRLGSGGFSAATRRPNGRWQFTGTVSSTGNVVIAVRANAGQGFQGSKTIDRTINVRLDTTAPTLAITNPQDNATINMSGATISRSVRGTVSDDHSGVRQVTVGIDDASSQATINGSQWNRTLTLRGIGQHTIVARATDRVGNSRGIRRTVRTLDTGKPTLTINQPESGDRFEWSEGLSIPVEGTARDVGTGVKSVEWRFSNHSEFQQAEDISGDWSRWRTTIPIARPGKYEIQFRCFDNADQHGSNAPNETSLTLTVHALRSTELEEDATSQRAYLKALVEFATLRLQHPNGDRVDAQLLNETFYQPFTELSRVDSVIRTVATRPVHQVRVCVEVLRKFLGEASAEAETSYRKATYRALLNNLNTSYEELNLARSEDETTRSALAARLSIEPDHLDLLFLEADTLTEADLEKLFGLADTRDDPLSGSADSVKQSQLLSWRHQRLFSLWQQQDHHQATPKSLPIVDPDLVDEADLQQPGEDSLVGQLWQARRTAVMSKLEEIKQAHSADTLDGFESLIETYLQLELQTLYEEREQGIDIREHLDAAGLTLAAFLHLARIRRMLERGRILASDWESVYAILLQAQKRRHLYPDWQAEEQQEELTLSPRYFKLRPASSQTLELLPWRASRQARLRWENTLQTRIQQKQAEEQSLRTVVETTEEMTLPLLRQALLQTIENENDDVDVANWLTQRLQIDINNSSSLKTTRLRQGIETMQAVLLSIRSGRFKSLPTLGDHDVPSASWEIRFDANYTGNDFDREWQVVGTYNTWRAEMLVWMYPENYLLPSLWVSGTAGQEPTAAFRKFIEDVRNQTHLTPERARKLAEDYLMAVRREPGANLPPDLRNFRLTEQRSFEDLNDLRKQVEKLFQDEEVEESESAHPHRSAPNYLKEIFFFVPLHLALHLQKVDEYLSALDWFRLVYDHHLPPNETRKIYYGLVLEERLKNDYYEIDDWRQHLNPHQIVSESSLRASAYTRFTLLSLVRCFLDFADEEFTRETSESIAHARGLYLTAIDLLDLKEMHPERSDADDAIPLPVNPVLETLRQYAELNLLKLRNGHNIAGIERQPDADLERDAGVVGAGEAIPHQIAPPPTRYRYTALVERAKHLVGIAQQIEAAFLAAVEKQGDRAYTLLQAHQDVELTRAAVQLRDLRVSEAEGNINLAQLQRQSSLIRRDTYQEWIDEGLIAHEEEMISAYQEAGSAQRSVSKWGAISSVVGQTSSMASSGATIGAAIGSVGGPLGMGVGAGVGLAAGLILGGRQHKHTKRAIDATTSAQVASVNASFEHRKQEWELQQALAQHDMGIGTQQIFLALTQSQIAGQEWAIADMQADHAEATVDFLATRFDNFELYEWMSGVLNQVYAYFLQQATAIARLAQRQLAFERQEPSPSYIQADYWRNTSEAELRGRGGNSDGDRRGLTGSARLLQAIYQLDQYAFETSKQKLELAQTFSLAQLVPFEFQRFRQTGVLPFATPMNLFDQAFPGHYLRLIKRVRVSVIALVPPVEGIRATLTSSGLSQTVIEQARIRSTALTHGNGSTALVHGTDEFQPVLIRRTPEQIAFTSPMDATGILELEPEKGLLMPFESSGIDTTWELRLPKPANRIDFYTVADVLFTIEYTALHSNTYARQVIEQLDRTFNGDRAFSFRQQFPDQWYDLNNPDQTGTPLRVEFTTRPENFPPNLDNLTICNVLLYFDRGDGMSFEVDVEYLLFTNSDSEEPVGGEARSIDGLISTRRPGSAEAWLSMVDLNPIGRWELALMDSENLRILFEDEAIEDIVFVINYEGQTPAWPA